MNDFDAVNRTAQMVLDEMHNLSNTYWEERDALTAKLDAEFSFELFEAVEARDKKYREDWNKLQVELTALTNRLKTIN